MYNYDTNDELQYRFRTEDTHIEASPLVGWETTVQVMVPTTATRPWSTIQRFPEPRIRAYADEAIARPEDGA